MDGSAAKKKPYSRADFLAWEDRQKERYEFLDGVITMMAGGSWAHNTIAGNIHGMLYAALRGKDCRPQQQNQKLAPEQNDDVTYPDVVVVCGKVPGDATFVSHATVIVEVLSDSSRARDTLRKWDSYRAIPQLRQYLLVEQEKALVTMLTRDGEDAPWHETTVEGLKGRDDLTAIGVKLPMARIYEGVDL